jgi:hypothetical protein
MHAFATDERVLRQRYGLWSYVPARAARGSSHSVASGQPIVWLSRAVFGGKTARKTAMGAAEG